MTHMRFANLFDFTALACISVLLLLSACSGGHYDTEGNSVSNRTPDGPSSHYYPRSDIVADDNQSDCRLCKSIAMYGMVSECCVVQ